MIKYKFLLPLAVIAVSTAGAGKSWAIDEEPYCREFTQIIEVGGKREEGYGTACQQPDGSWKIVKDENADYDATQIDNSEFYINEERVVVVPRTTIVYERYPIYRPIYRPYYSHFSVVYNYPPYRSYNRGYYRNNSHHYTYIHVNKSKHKYSGHKHERDNYRGDRRNYSRNDNARSGNRNSSGNRQEGRRRGRD